MAKGSTKYQLLKDDFDHACRELKLQNELIADLRKENEKLKDRLDAKIVFVNNGWEEERYTLQEEVLELQQKIQGLEEQAGEMAEKHAEKDIILDNMQQEIKEWERISDKQVEHLTRNGKEIIKLTEQLEQAQQEIERLKKELRIAELGEFFGS